MPPAVGGGTVEIGPTQNVPVSLGQPWVFVDLSGFQPDETVDVQYCDSSAPLTSGTSAATMVCAEDGGTAFARAPDVVLHTFSDGTSATSFQVPYWPSSNGTPIVGNVPGDPTKTGSFYCTGGSHPCAVVITVPDASLGSPAQTPITANSLVVPIDFNATTAGCPAKTEKNGGPIDTESDYGIGTLFPVISRIACATESAPVLPDNTENSGVQALTDAVAGAKSGEGVGSIEVAFTDDPEDPNQQAQLKAEKFTLIPVALTANVIGYEAEMSQEATVYPEPNLDLTANMVAGLMTGYYSDPYVNDLYTCGKVTCSVPPCFPASTCSLFTQANNVQGFFSAKQYGSYPIGGPSGTTDALMHWLCTAPPASVNVGTTPVPEAMTAAQTMVAGLKAGGDVTPTCPVTDQFPSLDLTSNYWLTGNSPQDQLKAIAAAVPGLGAASTAIDGFAPMNWAWADFLGLDTAALQNGGGAFVAPSEQSLDAAVADATSNPDGTLTFKYPNTDASAYAMPAVFYAAVPVGALSTSERQRVQALLDGILDVTGGAHSADLPAGFVPLTPALYKQAQQGVACLVASTCTTTTTTTTPPQQGGGSSGLSSGGLASPYGGYSSGPYGGLSDLGSGQANTVGTGATGGSTSPGAARKHHGATVPSSSPLYAPFALAASSSRLLFPLVLAFGLAAVLLGALLLFWGSLRHAVGSMAGALIGSRAGAVGPPGPAAPGEPVDPAAEAVAPMSVPPAGTSPPADQPSWPPPGPYGTER